MKAALVILVFAWMLAFYAEEQRIETYRQAVLQNALLMHELLYNGTPNVNLIDKVSQALIESKGRVPVHVAPSGNP